MTGLQNRDRSWLRFNKRVLNESTRDIHPLMERVLFLRIASNNLKEFAMIRVASLKSLAKIDDNYSDRYENIPLKELIKKLNKEIKLQREAILLSGQQLLKGLAQEGIIWVDYESLSDAEQDRILKEFKDQYYTLSFPVRIKLSEFLLSVKSNQLYRLFKTHNHRYYQLGFLEEIPYGMSLGENRYVRTDHLLYALLKAQKKTYLTANFIRDADLNFDAFDDDELPKKLKTLLSKRDQLSLSRVHLKSPDVKTILPDFLALKKLVDKEILSQKNFESWELMHAYLNQIIPNNHPTLRNPPYQPKWPKSLRPDQPIIPQIQAADQLWHYPYDSFTTFERLLLEAAYHPDVKTISMTMYRLAQNSAIIELLKLFVKNKKKVRVVLELRARFDEANNLYYAEILKAAGCEVAFGPKKVKIHAKMMVMTLKNQQYITQIGSGNYHEITALKYTDFAYLTAHPEIGAEASAFFDAIMTKKPALEGRQLLVGPAYLKKRLIELMDQEIALKNKGYIGFKINALTDQDIIDKLIEASQKGVQIQAIIRSIHCLLPGIKGLTETIEVVSLVGRYLEHSRVYIFGRNAPQIYVGSSDLMSRNLQRRHEILCPVLDPMVQEKLLTIFSLTLKDTLFTARINSAGQHIMKNDSIPFSIHQHLMA